MAIYNLNFEELWVGNLDFDFGAEEGQDSRIIDISLNIGINVLDIYYYSCYVFVCTTAGVECLNSRTFDSIWYFDSEEVKAVCYNGEKVCFGTISGGAYYSDFPNIVGKLDNFLAECSGIDRLTSSNISDICVVETGFFIGGDCGVDRATNYGINELKVDCQLTCSGVNSVAYSADTGTYYWSTASTAYSADACV